MFLPVDNNPSIIRAAMGCTVDVVDTDGESALAWEEGLAICKDSSVGTGGDVAIEIIVAHDFHQPDIAIGHGDAEGKDFVVAVRSSVLSARCTDGDAADHNIVDGVALLLGDQFGKFLIYLRGTTCGNGNVSGKKHGYGQLHCGTSKQYAQKPWTHVHFST